MVVEDINLFPILVRRIPNFLSQEECDTIIKRQVKTNFHEHGALEGDASSTFDFNVGSDKVYALDLIDQYLPINGRVFDSINDYVRDMGVSPVKIDNSWINVQGPGSRLHDHMHPISVVSGALYIKVDSDSSSINFHNPNPFVDMFDVKRWTVHTFKTSYIPPTTGDLLLFPSWLKHGSNQPNRSQERIVLSFNTSYIPV
jgi:uncharacterized protein (TIGR02466 family)